MGFGFQRFCGREVHNLAVLGKGPSFAHSPLPDGLAARVEGEGFSLQRFCLSQPTQAGSPPYTKNPLGLSSCHSFPESSAKTLSCEPSDNHVSCSSASKQNLTNGFAAESRARGGRSRPRCDESCRAGVSASLSAGQAKPASPASTAVATGEQAAGHYALAPPRR